MRIKKNGKCINSKSIATLVITLIVCAIIACILLGLECISVIDEIDGAFYFNIITIDSIIAGFSFTNSGTIMSMSGTELQNKLDGTDIVETCVKRLIHSIVYCCASLIIGILYGTNILRTAHIIINAIFQIEVSENIVFFLKLFCFISSVLSLVIGTIYFCLSLRSVSKLALKIYEKKQKYTNEQIKYARDTIRNDFENSEIKEKDYFESD